VTGAERQGAERHGVVQAGASSQEIYDGGMTVRREVLGDAHVDRANANKDDFTEDFQDMITRIAWASPRWWRTGTGRAGHVRIRALLSNGVGRDEIEEILLQTAIYGGIFSTNTAFKTAQQVFREMDTTP
jgi:4-carboxymuconolactone decarboxylase